MRLRKFISLAAIALLAAPTSALAVEAFTSSIPPFSMESGAKPGFVRELVTEMAKRAGTQLPIVYGKSWPQSQEEAKTKVDTIIFPLARTSAREPHYQWLQKIVDFEVAFATAPGKPKVENEDAARKLAKLGVRDGAPMAKFLKGRGYTNLVVLKTSGDLVKALAAGEINAWYAPVPEVAFNWIEQKLSGAPVYGLKLESLPLFIATSRNTPGIDFAKWQSAYASMEKDGTVKRILSAYGLK